MNFAMVAKSGAMLQFKLESVARCARIQTPASHQEDLTKLARTLSRRCEQARIFQFAENAEMTHDEPETVIVETERVSCDGGGVLGHPKVWYQIPRDTGRVECGYCDRVFVLKGWEGSETK